VILDRLYPPHRQRVDEDHNKGVSQASTPANFTARPSIVVQASSDERVSQAGSPLSNVFSPISGPLLAEALRQTQARRLLDVPEPHIAKAPDHLRPILLKVLKRLLEAGVPYGYAHRLFRLARKAPPPKTAVETPEGMISGAGSSVSTPTGSPSGKRRPAKLKLQINTTMDNTLEQSQDGSGLDEDILEVIKHGMTKRWPDMFCFSARSARALPTNAGAVQEREGGSIVGKELGKVWPNSTKGYTYLVSDSAGAFVHHAELCIYI
jgi:hypothetical protein